MVVRFCIITVACATVFYLTVVLAAAKAAPRVSLAISDLPAVAALANLPWSGALKTALLFALVASVLKTWSSVFMMSVRLLFAQARERMIPAVFGSINAETCAPDKAVIAVGLFNFAGLFFGKGILEPIVNIMSLSIALIYAVTCAATLALRRQNPDAVGFRVRGGTPVAVLAIGLAVAMAAFALFQPAQYGLARALKWVLLVSWSGLGLSLYYLQSRQPLDVQCASNPMIVSRDG
jgi:amino acid transporter